MKPSAQSSRRKLTSNQAADYYDIRTSSVQLNESD
jgi:hypothetical protein